MSERHPNDVYETPLELSLAIARDLAPRIEEPRLILSPWCGSGSFIRAARATWPHAQILAMDVRPECRADALASGADDFKACDFAEVTIAPVDLILDNPPYVDVDLHAAAALRNAVHIGLLLRMSVHWSKAGLRLLGLTGKRDVTPLAERPSYSGTGGQTDMVGSAIYRWHSGYRGPCELRPSLSWKAKPVQSALALGGVR